MKRKIRLVCLAIPLPSILHESVPSTFNLVYILFAEDTCKSDFTPYLLPWECFFFPFFHHDSHTNMRIITDIYDVLLH